MMFARWFILPCFLFAWCHVGFAQVRLNEFMAANEKTLIDQDKQLKDWIEIHNAGTSAASLKDYTISDDPEDPKKWKFPAVTVSAQGFLVIFASGKDRPSPAELHTNFSLEDSGGFLGLYDPTGKLISSVNYAEQKMDASFGYYNGLWRYSSSPSPRAVNRNGLATAVAEPVISPAGGVYRDSVTVTLKSPTSGAIIRYTLDGSDPTGASPAYSKPLIVTTNTLVRARSFQSVAVPSDLVSQNFLITDDSLKEFKSNLPLVVINTFGKAIVPDVNSKTSALFIDTFRGRSSLHGTNEFNGRAGIRIRGQSSAGFPKKAYAVELQNEVGNDLKASLLGLPEESDWILYNPYTDKSFMRNVLAYQLWRDMGHWGARTRFVEAFVNTTSNKLTRASYVGVYVLMEKIKISDSRLDIEKLLPSQNSLPEVSGSYTFKMDKLDPGEGYDFTTAVHGIGMQFVEPDKFDITTPQRQYLANYLRDFEATLSSYTTRDRPDGYSKYISVPDFIDYGWMVELPKNCDMLTFSTYMHKARNGKLAMGPVWDFDIGFGNINYNTAYIIAGWYSARIGGIITMPWYTALHADPDYEQKSIDRWQELRSTVFSVPHIWGVIDGHSNSLAQAAVRNYERWPILGKYVWPNPCLIPVIWPHLPGGSMFAVPDSGSGSPCPAYLATYGEEVFYLRKWVKDRSDWIDMQFVPKPSLGLPPGRMAPGATLTMSNALGVVFYTLDGRDPRAPGGLVADYAQPYTSPIALQSNARVFARSWFTNSWSGPAVGTYVVKVPPLVISEVMYHPSNQGSTDGDEFEFIELKNTSASPLPLAKIQLQGGIRFVFPDAAAPLGPGNYLVLAKNRTAFQSRYGTEIRVDGQYEGSLNNSGERIELLGSLLEPIHTFAYDPERFPTTDGLGFSLVPVDEKADPAQWSDSAQWRSSAAILGSPGIADPVPTALAAVRINEISPFSVAPELDWVELFNPASTAVDIGGWFLTDNFSSPRKYQFPRGTTIAPQGYLVVSQQQFDGGSGFSFGSDGEEVYLFGADTAGNLTGYFHGFSFGATDESSSFGPARLTGSGYGDSIRLRHATPGKENAGPKMGPLVITEIMYHPPDIVVDGQAYDVTEDEFIEIHNAGGEPISLNDSAGSWGLRGAVDFDFPANAALAPGSYLVVVGFDPVVYASQLQAFRTKYQMPAGAAILGPYRGKLDNSNDEVKLVRKRVISGETRTVTMDTVTYKDEVPWTAADGTGSSLHRKNPLLFGDDPRWWTSAEPGPGKPYARLSDLTFTTQPQDVTRKPGEAATFDVAVANPGGLQFSWLKNGAEIAGGSLSKWEIPATRLGDEGLYSLLVWNETAAAVSREAHLKLTDDADGDGMPDAWELQHGLDPNDPKDATRDHDSDGMSNHHEFLAGTDPTKALQVFKIDSVARENQFVTIRFQAQPGKVYTVQYKDRLTDAVWKNLKTFPAETASKTQVFQDADSFAARFYRLTVQP